MLTSPPTQAPSESTDTGGGIDSKQASGSRRRKRSFTDDEPEDGDVPTRKKRVVSNNEAEAAESLQQLRNGECGQSLSTRAIRGGARSVEVSHRMSAAKES